MTRKPDEILSESAEAAKIYAQTEVERLKLKLARRITRYLSAGIHIVTLIGLGIVILLFATFGLAIFWGRAIGNIAHAFFYMALIVLGIFLFIAFFSKKIITAPIMRKVIKELMEDE